MRASAPTLFDLPARNGATNGRQGARPPAIAPLLKWPGGKSSELQRILSAAPTTFARYFEPFVGGGAAFFSIPAEVPSYINDASVDLMDFYALVKQQDQRLSDLLLQIDEWWQAIEAFTESAGERLVNEFLLRRSQHADASQPTVTLSDSELANLAATVPPDWSLAVQRFLSEAEKIVPKKIQRMRKIELQRNQRLPIDDVWANIEGAFKASCYTTLRAIYNSGRLRQERSPRQSCLFFFLREYAYAAMFRFNASGEFNVPYGGVSYNRKAFPAKIEHLMSDRVADRLRNTTIECMDFEEFLCVHPPSADDFVFLDPPYDSDFSDYDLNAFDRGDHRRLASVMAELPCAFQLVIKSTPAVLEIYSDSAWEVLAFDKKYMWTIKERNNRDATHLMITNSSELIEMAS